MAGRKIFVGSLPDNIDSETLQLEFSKYGVVEDVFVKPNCDSGRQWAFITFQAPDQAQLAKDSCDRVLTLPGAARPCDVMLAKNQGMFGQDPMAGGGAPVAMHHQPAQAAYDPLAQDLGAGTAPKKVFVGSLPDGMQEAPLRAEFSKYGLIEEVYMKAGCEPGRQWAFVSFQSHEMAQAAAHATHGKLIFPGGIKTCEVTLARNQGMFGQGNMSGQPSGAYQAQTVYPPGPGAAQHSQALSAPRKIFVGSLPDGIDDFTLRSEFSKYGEVTDVFIKPGCEPGRQWAFISYTSPEQAQYAKDCCDCILMFPGGQRTCEVTMARNQGMFGQDRSQDSIGGAPSHQAAQAAYQPQVQQIMAEGPKKIFVGSLPDGITDPMLRAEFSKYGQVIDCFLKTGCEPGRQWAFVSFAASDQAQYAKECCDRILTFPGAAQACEVMLAKNQGKFGQAPLNSTGGDAAQVDPHYGMGGGAAAMQADPHYGYAHQAPAAAPVQAVHVPPGAVPPPPNTPPPAHLTAWKMYKTVAGLPYYHNSATGVTQWECPPELQGLPSTSGGGPAGVRYGPY